MCRAPRERWRLAGVVFRWFRPSNSPARRWRSHGNRPARQFRPHPVRTDQIDILHGQQAFHFPRREIPVSIRTSQIWPRWFNSAFASRSLQTAIRVANFDSEVPALNRRELGANPRQPTRLRSLRSTSRLPRRSFSSDQPQRSRRGDEADPSEPPIHLLTSVATVPRCIISRAPVSDTGGLGAIPGGAATLAISI